MFNHLAPSPGLPVILFLSPCLFNNIQYQAESAPKHLRGAIVSGYQWAITIGLLIASVIVNATQLFVRRLLLYPLPDLVLILLSPIKPGPSAYRIPIAVQFIWAAILGIGLQFLPESPRYLIMRGKDEQAQKALARILSAPIDSAIVNEEFADIAVCCPSFTYWAP